MAVTRANVEATKAFIRARIGNPYVYGGALSTNVRQGTDCSEVWQTVLEMVHGRWKPGRQSEGATTESYRYIPVGGVGPFGTIRVAHWRDIPANAAAKLAFHHGPGGGANSHMWGELDGMLIESGGSKGLVTNGRALAIDNSYGHAWAYLPGPIVDDGTPVPPAPPEVVMLGRRFESSGDRVRQLQEALNRNGARIEVDGDFGPLTENAVTAFQRSRGLEIDGIAGPATLAALGLTFGAPPPPPPPPGPARDGLTAQVLFDIAAQPAPVRVPLWRYAELLPLVVELFHICNAHTVKRRAMLTAQVFHENGRMYYKREIHDGSNYEGRCRDLGNCQPGDGRRFPGRGWIQLTGRDNVTGFSEWMYRKGLAPTPHHFVDHPEQMETDRNAMLTAAYYWTVKRPQLNALADAGDLLGATKAINGGTNGLDDRRDLYARALAAGDRLLDPDPADELEELLMMELESWSIYATPGEPKIPAHKMIQAIDAKEHRDLTDIDAKNGDIEAIRRVARTAAGLGKYGNAAGPVAHATRVLNEIQAENPQYILAATPGKA
jgi:predicted chitinase